MEIRKTSLGQTALGLSYYPAEFLSKRKFKKLLKLDFTPQTLLDLGCGYDYLLTKNYIDKFEKVYLADVSINQQSQKIHNNIEYLVGDIHESIKTLEDKTIGFVYANNIFEHLDNPTSVLIDLQKVISDDGVIYISVPSWFGKFFLELFAFRLNIAPVEEMDDHKEYFNKKELWKMLVKAGIKPSSIKVKIGKFGITRTAVIKKNLRFP